MIDFDPQADPSSNEGFSQEAIPESAATRYRHHASKPAPGIVNTQAHAILNVVFQRTAETRLTARVPEMAPVITCVVLTGMPSMVERKMLKALASSAQKPSSERSFAMP